MAVVMCKTRTIKPEFFFDSELASLPLASRIVFIGLWCYADREGRLKDDPKKIKACILPYDIKVNMDKVLDSLSHKPFIIRYTIDSKRYIQIVRWRDHQLIHHTEQDSCIPPPNGEFTVNTPLDNGETPVGEGRVGKGRVVMTNPLEGKVKHLEFVYLSEKEYTLLCEHIGKGNADSYIARLNDYIGAKGKKYNSHYHVISGWWRRDHPETSSTGPAGREL